MANVTYTSTSAPSLVMSSVAGSPCVDVRDSQSLTAGLGVNVLAPYDLMTYQRLASALYAHPAGHPPVEGLQVPVSAATPPHPQILPPQDVLLHGGGLELKEGIGGIGAGWPYTMYYPYDSLASYPFAHGYGMAFDASRRKNATRETTATLKAWLNEHKKNPYPTKGEKIMLAIITKMTLTQVSTWFANARRRLKKENKMTWEPRNKTDEDDDDDDFKDDMSSDNERRKDCNDGSDRGRDDMGDLNGSMQDDLGRDSPHHAFSIPTSVCGPSNTNSSSSSGLSTSSPVKPRIWCLADMAASTSSSVAPAVVGGSKYLHRPIHLETSPYGRPLQSLSHRIASPHEALLQVYAKSLGFPPHMAASFPPLPAINGIGTSLVPPHSLGSEFPIASSTQSQMIINRPLATRPNQGGSPISPMPHILPGGAKLTPTSSHSPSSSRSDEG